MSNTTSTQVSSSAAEKRQHHPALPGDVATLDSILHCMYAMLSGPAGQRRDWDRFRSLFLPGARLILAIQKQGEKPWARLLDVESYIRRVDPIFERESFWEKQADRQVQIFGNIAHVFSTFESCREKDGKPFQRGINSIQLFFDNTRWWIVTVMWNTERE